MITQELLNSKTKLQQHFQKIIGNLRDNINRFALTTVSYDDKKKQWKVFKIIAQLDKTPQL